MSRKLTVLSAILLLALLWGCQQEETVVKLEPRNNYMGSGAETMWVKVTATGDWTLELEYSGSERDWASTDLEDGRGTGNANVRLYAGVNSSDDPRQVTLVLTPAKGKAVSTTVTQSGKSASAIVGHYGYDVAPMDWLELPAMTANDGRELLAHNMEGGKYVSRAQNGVRNWSCYWDYAEHLSPWVAYPLNNAIKGSGSRSNAWSFDPMLPENLQPDLTKGSYGGGSWTRGHQIPSADRLASYAANKSTFVPTNLTPQDYDFNGGIWANLEGKVRDYAAKSDTLYVVTGCIFENSSKYSGSKSGFMVKVPTYYYKALLYRGSNSAATDGFMMAAFILPHDTSIANGNCLSYICSVDELERQTGVDFFPNLARLIGSEKADALEAQAPGSFWK